MLVSSTSMKAAIATTTAINQGLNFGTHTEADAAPAVAVVWPLGALPLVSGLSAMVSTLGITTVPLGESSGSLR